MTKGLSTTQIRLRTGAVKLKGNLVGGLVLPKDVGRDRRKGLIKIVGTKYGVKIQTTAKGKMVFKQRVSKMKLK